LCRRFPASSRECRTQLVQSPLLAPRLSGSSKRRRIPIRRCLAAPSGLFVPIRQALQSSSAYTRRDRTLGCRFHPASNRSKIHADAGFLAVASQVALQARSQSMQSGDAWDRRFEAPRCTGGSRCQHRGRLLLTVFYRGLSHTI